MSAKNITLQIISEQPKGQMTMVDLGRRLQKEQALGFGVEVEDIVSALLMDGKVMYNSRSDVIRLSTKQEQERYFLKSEMKSCLVAADELYRNDGYMSTDI